MKSFKQLRSEVNEGVWQSLKAGLKAAPGAALRLGWEMTKSLAEPSFKRPSPLIDLNKNKTQSGYAIHAQNRRDQSLVTFRGRNAEQERQRFIQQNRDYDPIMESSLTAAQKLALMGDNKRADTLAALRRLDKVKDVNKLSTRHRTIVMNFLTKTGGLDNVNPSIARRTLSMYKKMSD